MCRKCVIIHQLHHLIYPVTDSMLHGNTSETAVAHIELFSFLKRRSRTVVRLFLVILTCWYEHCSLTARSSNNDVKLGCQAKKYN